MVSKIRVLGLIAKNQWLLRRLESQKHLLGKILRVVELETHSYCNRVCSFCPNVFFDRRKETNYLPSHLFTKIVSELGGVGFSGELQFIRYMEPLADPVIFERIREARSYLPLARLIANTNGDYFGEHTLQDLSKAGLNELNIARYIDKPAIWTIEKGVKLCEHFLHRHRLQATLRLRNKGHVLYNIHYGQKMKVALYSFDYVNNRFDRGGSISGKPYSRVSPCSSPFISLHFDSNGECLPCCNMRSDNPDHRSFSYGNIADHSLLDLFNSQAAQRMRAELATFTKDKPSPCKGCSYHAVKFSGNIEKAWNLLQAVAASRKHPHDGGFAKKEECGSAIP